MDGNRGIGWLYMIIHSYCGSFPHSLLSTSKFLLFLREDLSTQIDGASFYALDRSVNANEERSWLVGSWRSYPGPCQADNVPLFSCINLERTKSSCHVDYRSDMYNFSIAQPNKHLKVMLQNPKCSVYQILDSTSHTGIILEIAIDAP